MRRNDCAMPRRTNNATNSPQTPPGVSISEWLDAGDALADALEACQIRMGCHSCDGDGFCEQCDKVYYDAEKVLYAWNAMREGSLERPVRQCASYYPMEKVRGRWKSNKCLADAVCETVDEGIPLCRLHANRCGVAVRDLPNI